MTPSFTSLGELITKFPDFFSCKIFVTSSSALLVVQATLPVSWSNHSHSSKSSENTGQYPETFWLSELGCSSLGILISFVNLSSLVESSEKQSWIEKLPMSSWSVGMSVGNCPDYQFDLGRLSPWLVTPFPKHVVLGCIGLVKLESVSKPASRVPSGFWFQLLLEFLP